MATLSLERPLPRGANRSGQNLNTLRFFNSQGQLLPTQAEAAIKRVDAAEAELARLRVELAKKQR